VLYVVALIAIIITVDALFFRDHFWERLIVTSGIVLVFAVSYWRFIELPQNKSAEGRATRARACQGDRLGTHHLT
jgi:hypothetical protein